jgi:hypothetical protein
LPRDRPHHRVGRRSFERDDDAFLAALFESAPQFGDHEGRGATGRGGRRDDDPVRDEPTLARIGNDVARVALRLGGRIGGRGARHCDVRRSGKGL